jgi:putative membrane protein
MMEQPTNMLPARPSARAYRPQNTVHDTRLECGRAPHQSSEGLEMDNHFKEKSVADGRDDLAEERTFLAWIRTGIALMGFGFVVAHFGISADGTYLGHAGSGVPPHAPSLWFGTLLIVVGVAVNLFSARRFAGLAGELTRGQALRRYVSEQGVVVALVLALLGIAMAICVLLGPGPQAGATGQ